MDAITAQTELEAVNEMLAAISESPVDSIDASNADAAEAARILRQESRKVQQKGWWFNTELVTLTPNGSNELVIPSNALRVRTLYADHDRRYVVRGLKLYDTDENTFTITTPIEVEIIYGLDWTVLPDVAREYITSKAGYVFCDTQMGAEPNRIFTREREREAKADLMKADAQGSRANALRDNQSAANVMRRGI